MKWHCYTVPAFSRRMGSCISQSTTASTAPLTVEGGPRAIAQPSSTRQPNYEEIIYSSKKGDVLVQSTSKKVLFFFRNVFCLEGEVYKGDYWCRGHGIWRFDWWRYIILFCYKAFLSGFLLLGEFSNVYRAEYRPGAEDSMQVAVKNLKSSTQTMQYEFAFHVVLVLQPFQMDKK